MKIKVLKLSILPLFLIIAVLQQNCLAQQKKINIQINVPGNLLYYAANEIKKAAIKRNYAVKLSSELNDKANEDLVVRINSDSASSVKIAEDENLKTPGSFGWQCYAIRVKNNGKQKIIYVLSGDKTGAMYGGLDIA